MNSYWKEVEGLESSQLSAKEKVTAWRGALAKFTDDNPFSTDDETLRSHAKERVSYWEGKAKEGDRAAKAAKARRKQKKATSAIERLSDGRFIKNTNGVVTDNRTGLQWYVGPGKGTNWYEAKRWVEALNIAGGSWRMPSMDELKGLYQQGNSIQNLGPIFGTSTRWVWSGNTRPPSDAWSFNTKYGLSLWTSCDNRDNMSFAVRSFSQKASLSKNQSTLTEHLTNSIGMQFVLIPAGNFIMGSKSNPEEIASRYGGKTNDFLNEHPQHRVTITKAFYMQTTEVTQAQWKAVMGTTPWLGKKYVKSNCPNCPAVYISWEDANAYIIKLNHKEGGSNYRLPTEAEWEYAARAGHQTAYCFGDDTSRLDDYAWFSQNTWDEGDKYAHPVGEKKSNNWGLYDIHGNIWEWVQDWYQKSYYQSSSTTNPICKDNASGSRVLRGGSWLNKPWELRLALRGRRRPTNQNNNQGFRLVRIVQ